MQESKALHHVLGVLLVLIAFFVIVALVMVNSQATDTNTTVVIENMAPSVETIYLSDLAEPGDGSQQEDDYLADGGLIDNLEPGGNKVVFVNGIVEDNNGATDITNVTGALFRTSKTSTCSIDKNDCYKDVSCETYPGLTSDQLYYSCGPFDIAFFADSTSVGGAYPADTWTTYVSVDDGTESTSDSIIKEIETFLSLYVPDIITYGTLALGVSTTIVDNQEMVIIQYGNDESDVEVSSLAPMSCAVRGSIPVGNQEWSLIDVDYLSGNPLSSTPTDTNLNVGYRTNDELPLTQTLYWNIGIPSSGVEGTCLGTAVVSAIAH